MSKGIFFQEISDQGTDFLQELNDPALMRADRIPLEVSIQLRDNQIRKLEGNIETLRSKQSEFNRKMEEYITNLRRLIESLERANGIDSENASDSSPDVAPPSQQTNGIHVSCLKCEDQKTFPDLRIIFARESEESILTPTECYVAESGEIKKGVFFCSDCGGEMLTIRAR